MICRVCGTELVPLMVTDTNDKEIHFKSGGEYVYECPNGCKLCNFETKRFNERMANKPEPQIPKMYQDPD